MTDTERPRAKLPGAGRFLTEVEVTSSMPVNMIPMIHISSEDAQRFGLSRETERKDPLQ